MTMMILMMMITYRMRIFPPRPHWKSQRLFRAIVFCNVYQKKQANHKTNYSILNEKKKNNDKLRVNASN